MGRDFKEEYCKVTLNNGSYQHVSWSQVPCFKLIARCVATMTRKTGNLDLYMKAFS